MTADIFFTGLEDVDRTLNELPRKLRNSAVRKATRASAKVIQAVAMRLVPEDEGNLRKSIKVRVAKGRKGKRLPRGVSGHAIKSFLFTGDTYYGGFIEFGTKPRQIKKSQRGTSLKARLTRGGGQNRGSVTPDPFLRPALYGSERTVKFIFRRQLVKFIRELHNPAPPPKPKGPEWVGFDGQFS